MIQSTRENKGHYLNQLFGHLKWNSKKTCSG